MTATFDVKCNDERNIPELTVLSQVLRGKAEIKFTSGDALCLNNELYSSATIAKHILEKSGRQDLLGNAADILELENWMRFSQLYLSDKRLLTNGLAVLDQALAHASYLIGNSLTCADIFIWSKLKVVWDDQDKKNNGLVNVTRYFNHLSAHPELSSIASCLDNIKASRNDKESSPVMNGPKFEEGGKFVELPGAEMGKVVVRFPPEASGYLHVGHAKAALLNQYYQQSFKGKLILRFDDTNPAKETEEFERVILEDVKMLGITHDMFSHTSDHFDTLILMCERLLVEGKAYVDDTDAEAMKAQRERREESSCRNNTVQQNIDAWEEMKKGSEIGLRNCVRAKIDMKSDNGCMRDPTIYRCKNEPHISTGTKYKVYPTYDFACPIVDSIEGVTHALRTTEYHDRDVQYYWFVEQLGIRRPIIYDYSRLNLQNTVLSKRKLTWFVQEGIVSGWDDPRFPTVRGILRKGLTIEGLKQFIIAQGSSKSICIMEWDKIWSFNKKVIDPVAPRYTALDRVNVVPVIVSGQAAVESREVAAHPKNAEVGNKKVWYGPRIWMEREDADAITGTGINVTFINWGNLRITGLEKGKDGHVTEVKAELNLDDKDFKKTMKVTWLADADGEGKTVPVVARHYGHIISKPVLTKTDDFKNFINKDSLREELLMGDPMLRHLKKGEIIQLQRRGFFIVDKAYEKISSSKEIPSPLTGLGSPCVLIYIPDGHTKTHGGEAQTSSSSGGSAKKQQSPKKGQKSPQRSQKSSATAGADKAFAILVAIKEQGDKVRDLKTSKASKEDIGKAVEHLLQLKKDFRAESGSDWKPDLLEKAQKTKSEAPAAAKVPADQRSQKSSATADGDKAYAILMAIKEEGDKIRTMKEAKASKEEIGKAVERLLQLKKDFRAESGTDWKPDLLEKAKKEKCEAQVAPTLAAASGDDKAYNILMAIKEQGDKIRKMKEAKASKDEIGKAVEQLLQLKKDYRAKSGADWKPDLLEKAQKTKNEATVSTKTEDKQADNKEGRRSQKSSATASSDKAYSILLAIKEQGDKIRNMKSAKASKDEIGKAVESLLQLKKDLRAESGTDWKPDLLEKMQKGKNEPQPDSPKVEEKQAASGDPSAPQLKKQTRLGLEAKKETDLPEWYSQVITKSEMIEYYDVSGCYILRPWSYAIWEEIKAFFDYRIKKIGVRNAYFPIFVSQSALEREKTHIADFAPEVAWVTRSGKSELAEPIAVRPTSETVMYPSYAKWIQSHRDLPILLNQWNNVVRWEFKHPQPFLRTREFLWQEGHTAHATKEAACKEVYIILDFYAAVYEELLAIPVVKGRKTEKEKFAGGDFTTTVEAYIGASGRAIQGATSHHLGQNFSKMFEIVFEDPDTAEKRYVYQNSWGLTTRTIGVICMVHGDNKGLVLPPRAACLQAIIVPCGITAKTTAEEKATLLAKCEKLRDTLMDADIRADADLRDHVSPGWKFNHWELKGVPLRIEIGPKDMSKKQVVFIRRDNGAKQSVDEDVIVEKCKSVFVQIHDSLYAKAKKDLDEHYKICESFDEFCSGLDKKCMLLSPFCGVEECEDEIKKDSARNAVVEDGAPSMGAKSLCIPFEQPRAITGDMKCINPKCSRKPEFFCLFGRSY